GITGEMDANSVVYAGYDITFSYNERLLSARPLLFPPLGNGAWIVTWHEKASTVEALKAP
ncbi:MAG: hypothetical protein LBK95_08480, partial [Bifidobacteriaceae bacterium]|nr:hypothetical protein [Bifidobacteriaceae bacterium]